jgi:LDH2 family malate/lactate/ureidoglycolate dehydrogenase
MRTRDATGAPGNLLSALDVEAFMPQREFLARVEAHIDQVNQSERTQASTSCWPPESAATGATWSSPPAA